MKPNNQIKNKITLEVKKTKIINDQVNVFNQEIVLLADGKQWYRTFDFFKSIGLQDSISSLFNDNIKWLHIKNKILNIKGRDYISQPDVNYFLNNYRPSKKYQSRFLLWKGWMINVCLVPNFETKIKKAIAKKISKDEDLMLDLIDLKSQRRNAKERLIFLRLDVDKHKALLEDTELKIKNILQKLGE